MKNKLPVEIENYEKAKQGPSKDRTWLLNKAEADLRKQLVSDWSKITHCEYNRNYTEAKVLKRLLSNLLEGKIDFIACHRPDINYNEQSSTDCSTDSGPDLDTSAMSQMSTRSHTTEVDELKTQFEKLLSEKDKQLSELQADFEL